MPYKASVQLAMNVRYLLDEFHVTQADLCAHAKVDPSTFTKFMQGKRELQLFHLDGIASKFGLSVYQLFQPGISRLTDRRVIPDRRMGHDRRNPDRLAHVPLATEPRQWRSAK